MRARKLVNTLRIIWVLVILWAEALVFHSAVRKCGWPDNGIIDGPWRRVLLVADPQILDMQAYPDRPWLLRLLSQVMVDLNLRRSWRAMRALRPHAVIFLGDMMDRGRADISDVEYDVYQKRFFSIFKEELPTLYIPGNHDVGLGPHDSPSPLARTRYNQTFGVVPSQVRFGNHTFLLVDAPLLADEEISPGVGSSSALARAKELSRETTGLVILFSHIPLSRPDGADCGPLRERGTLRRGSGIGYQNTLGRQMSQALIKDIKPVVVFSGDDHDYCDTSASGVRDITVKSISMAMGVRHPGFQLLSLLDGQGQDSYATQPCLLPDQLGLYLNLYLPLIVFSLIVVGVGQFWGRRGSSNGSQSYNTIGMTALEREHDDIEGSTPVKTKLRKRSPSLPAPVTAPNAPGRGQYGSPFSPSLTSVPSTSVTGIGTGVSSIGTAFIRDVGAVAWPPVLFFGVLGMWSFL